MDTPAPPQELFREPIIQYQYMDPGYSGHASDVWVVQTPSRRVVVRSSRSRCIPDNEFWWGCWKLFGLDPTIASTMEWTSRALAGLGPIVCPGVLERRQAAGRDFLIVEWMPGTACQSFLTAPDGLMYGLGQWLAEVHGRTLPVFGTVDGETAKPLAAFHGAAVAVMDQLVQRYFMDEQDVVKALEAMQRAMKSLPVPTHSSLVMVDMDPTQFLMDAGRITAVVDTEAYVLAPPALELVALEYVLDQRTAAALAAGYASIRALPDLEAVREPYRYLCRLLDIQGEVPLAQWMGHPQFF